MTREDLMRMIDAANEIAVAAKRHEEELKNVLAMEVMPEDWQIGELFSPVSQAMANWRRRMGAMFPPPVEDEKEIADLAAIVDGWK